MNAFPDFGCVRFVVTPKGKEESLDCLVFRNKVVPLFDKKVEDEKNKA